MLALPRPSPGPVLGFGVDTFAFRNDSRIRCFLMARAVGQVHRFARFVPEEPRLASAAYALLVRRITRRAAWRAPLPDAERIVIPGFASLHALSREERAAVKDGLRGRLLATRALDELADDVPVLARSAGWPARRWPSSGRGGRCSSS